jgi:hypothetical protein
MAECLDTSAAPLLNSEVYEFLFEKREARQESAATHPKPRPGHPLETKVRRWVESRVRHYTLHGPCGASSAAQSKRALAVLAGDLAAAEEAAKELLESDPSAEEGADIIRRCGRAAGGWGLTDAERLQLVNLRCVSAVDVCVAASDSTYKYRMGNDDVDLCYQAIALLLPPPLTEQRGFGEAAASASHTAQTHADGARGSASAASEAHRSVRFNDS